MIEKVNVWNLAVKIYGNGGNYVSDVLIPPRKIGYN